MPGKNNSSSFHAQHVTDYAIYRASLAANDNPADPSLVTSVIDASAYPSALGLQIWITPQRVSGTGTVDLTLVFENNGSLAVVAPYKTIGTNASIASLQESRFTGLTAGKFRVLATNMDPGSVWTLHFALTTSLGISIPVTPGGAGVWGSITGTLTDQLDLVSALDLKQDISSAVPVIATNTTYYVRKDGNDSNTGLADTAGGAWLTIQKAADVLATKFIAQGVTVTVLVRTGTYAEVVTINPISGPGTVVFEGDTTTPANVTIGPASGYCVSLSARVTLRGFKLLPTSGGGLFVSVGGIVSISNLDFGAASGAHMRIINASAVTIVGNYTISGSSPNHISTAKGGIIATPGYAVVVTLTGTPAFSSAFCACGTCSNASLITGQISFSGSATGARYIAFLNGVIDTNGGGATFLPGNSAGALLTGGQYA